MRRARRPAAALPRLKRPAAAVEGGPQKSPEERWAQGEELLAVEYTPGLFGSGAWIRSCQASYFESACEFAGVVDKVVLQEREVELVINLTGTSNEELLRYASGIQPPVVRAHLCGPSCNQKRVNPDLVHLSRFRQLLADQEKTWKENLKDPDENKELRSRQEAWERDRRLKAREAEEDTDSRERGGKKKRAKTKEKKKERKAKNRKVGGKLWPRRRWQIFTPELGWIRIQRQEGASKERQRRSSKNQKPPHRPQAKAPSPPAASKETWACFRTETRSSCWRRWRPEC